MNFLCLVFASLALIVTLTSGELVPGRIERPRDRREIVRHVRSPSGSDHTRMSAEVSPHGARYGRSPYPILDDWELLNPDIRDIDLAFFKEFKIEIEKILSWLKVQNVDALSPEAKLKLEEIYTNFLKIFPDTDVDTETRRRRGVESLHASGLVHRTPSAARSQPMRRSAALSSPPGH